ncbi:MAG: dolichyl-phosphate beta-D-mannosyltransferase [Candidatus Marinimicrobia bacterium]|nr:dolichyl-phosphate beta-D-mannosyltransferase [Candidatus Neomarinimicrobiota bacterium]
MRSLIITPTYNEKKNIRSFIEKVFKYNDESHLLIVDDNSPDKTGLEVKELQKRFSKLFLKSRPKKQGLGTAYIEGFSWALKKNYKYMVQMDADLSHDPKDVKRLLKNLSNYDLVIGSRYIEGVSVVNWPIRRLMLSYGANLYSRLITGMPINDGTGGFKAWRASILQRIPLSDVQSQGYSFQIEMNFRAWILGARIKEESIIFFDRTVGDSKMSKNIVYEAILMVWKLRFWKIFGLI